MLRERCSQQRAALSQQQDKENQWKVRRRGGCSWAFEFVSFGCLGGLTGAMCVGLPQILHLAPNACKPSLHVMAACPLNTFMGPADWLAVCHTHMLQEREADLRLFVEVATQSCLPAGREGQELAQARVAEAKLKEQVRWGGVVLARMLWMGRV